MSRTGLYLQGGGAKGAFQVGALKAMTEEGIAFDILVGTSIGAINAMAIFYSGLGRMRELWLEMLKGEYGNDKSSPVLETKDAVKAMVDFLGTVREPAIRHFYVNYAPVENGQIRHEFKDLVKETDEEIMRYVSASSLLPNLFAWQEAAQPGKTSEELFAELIGKGKYDGYLLDGGLLNNRFMEPFCEEKADIIYGIVFDQDFAVPEVLWNHYQKEQIILIKPDFTFAEKDTMMFRADTFQAWFEAGYRQAKKTIK